MKLSLQSLRSGSAAVTALLFLSPIALADPPPAAVDLQPIPVTILKSSPKTAPGLIFLTPTAASPTGVQGAQIVDGEGRPVWFNQLPTGEGAYDFRVQSYHHEPVLTWIQSKGVFSTGPTTDYIADRHYHVIATVNAGNGLTADIHEFHLTREGTALITIYNTVTRDLSSVGGPTSGLVTEGVVQEINIANGHVLFEWHSLDHVGLDESHAPVSTSPTVAWDYFHLNAVSVDEDGNLLIDARNTWTAYRLDRHTGAVIWRLGGKKTDFVLGPNVAFAWEHNPTAVDDHGLVRIFDNEASPTILPYSRVIWVRHDDRNKTATLERWFKHPDGLSAGSQGNAQGLENGDTFIGWGALTRFSEIDENNNLLFDAELPDGYNSYRAYRFEWAAELDTRPVATAQRTTDGDTIVHAIWNGATEVARWDVVEAGDRDSRRVATASWNGLDTTIQVNEFVPSVAVVARDRAGREIGRSAAVEVTP
jgi:arylsulfotransferase ASST